MLPDGSTYHKARWPSLSSHPSHTEQHVAPDHPPYRLLRMTMSEASGAAWLLGARQKWLLSHSHRPPMVYSQDTLICFLFNSWILRSWDAQAGDPQPQPSSLSNLKQTLSFQSEKLPLNEMGDIFLLPSPSKPQALPVCPQRCSLLLSFLKSLTWGR